MASGTTNDLEAELGSLERLGLENLRRLWGERLRPVPRNHSASLLRRRLAWDLQAGVLGDLKPDARRQLKRLHAGFSNDGAYRPDPAVSLRPGLVLSREWQGTMHRVTVLGDGFEYRGERFGSLSQIARRITGTRWSGPLFFGLKAASRDG